MDAAMAIAAAARRVRCADRRRWRSRPRLRVLPCQEPWPDEHRCHRERTCRIRQCRPQHHHHPLQLPAARQHPILRDVPEIMGTLGAGDQLQRHDQPTRCVEPVSFRQPARCGDSSRWRDAPSWRGRGAAQSRRHPRPSSVSRLRYGPVSDHRGIASETRRHRPS